MNSEDRQTIADNDYGSPGGTSLLSTVFVVRSRPPKRRETGEKMMKRMMQTILALATIAPLTGCGTMNRMASTADAMPWGTSEKGMKSLEQNRMLIWHADLSLEVASVSNSVARVITLVKQSGGYVQSKSDSGEERTRMTLRVPAASLTSTMGSLEAMGEITHRRLSSTDVTEQYVDTDARLKTMTALRDRLRALLEKARDVKDVLAIEKELGRVQADIDSMQARLKKMKGQVDLATINVSIAKRKPARILGPLGYAFKGTWWVIEKLFVIRN
jgi:hypothetical protein